MNGWWAGSGIALVIAVLVAVLAGVAYWRRGMRVDPDKVGWVDWRSVQMFALIAAAVCVMFATHA